MELRDRSPEISDMEEIILGTASPACLAIAATKNLAPEHQWSPAAHLWAMDDALMDALIDPLSPRIIVVEAPPRHGKSEYWSRWVPAWYLGHLPGNRIGLVSYGANFAKSWGRKWVLFYPLQ